MLNRVLLLLFAVSCCGEPRAADPPNIIVIYTDDHGYADLSCQGVMEDVKTPHIDALAASGVRMTDGYCTAPQCVPSRAGLLTGQFQNRFGLESNPQGKDAGIMRRFAEVKTLPERLQMAGYATGMAGKWHLGPADQISAHGFDCVFFKHSNAPGFWNMTLDGTDIEPTTQHGGGYHLDLISQFACTFVQRHKSQPFFFYLAYRAPHVPLDPPQQYLDRFPGEMPERRRKALAMLSAVDDGVGQLVAKLREHDLTSRTLIFLVSDNGAPLKIHKLDAPGGGPGWDGSLNDPLNGEKGMLTEGGIRVPFVVSWEGTIPAGQTYRHPVITLDIAATALSVAGLPRDDELDGVNLLPYLTGKDSAAPHQQLFWRWLNQAAVRKGNWKYIAMNDRRYLFDLQHDVEELHNVAESHPQVTAELHEQLSQWTSHLSPPGLGALATPGRGGADSRFYDWYLDGKREAPPVELPGETKERKPPTTARRISRRELFKRRDKNRDGAVTLDEFLNGRSGAVATTLTMRFKALDRNGNGQWDSSEIPDSGA